MSKGSTTVVAIAFSIAAVAAQSPERPSIEALWGAVYDAGPRVRGELTIRAVNDGYIATIAGFEGAAGTATDHSKVPDSGSGGDWIQRHIALRKSSRARCAGGDRMLAVAL